MKFLKMEMRLSSLSRLQKWNQAVLRLQVCLLCRPIVRRIDKTALGLLLSKFALTRLGLLVQRKYRCKQQTLLYVHHNDLWNGQV